MFTKALLLASLSVAMLYNVASEASVKPVSQQSERQIATSPPLLPPSIGSGIGGLAGIIPAILPIILILGIGAFLLPAIGLLLFGSSGGFGGFFDGFSKKRSSNLGVDHPLFSTEKLIELIQTVTKALEEASKEG